MPKHISKIIFAIALLALGVLLTAVHGDTGSFSQYPYYITRSETWVAISSPTTNPPEFFDSTKMPMWSGFDWRFIPKPPVGIIWSETGWTLGNPAPERGVMGGVVGEEQYVWNGAEYILVGIQALNSAQPPTRIPSWDFDRDEWILIPPPPKPNPLCSVNGYPDLTVDSITTNPSPTELGPSDIKIVVKNSGNAFAAKSITRVLIEGKDEKLFDTPVLDCGDSVALSFTYFFTDVEPKAFVVWVDYNEDVAESQGENGNSAGEIFSAIGPDFYADVRDLKISDAGNNLNFDLTVHNIGASKAPNPPYLPTAFTFDFIQKEVLPSGADRNNSKATRFNFILNNIPSGGSSTFLFAVPKPVIKKQGDQYIYSAMLNSQNNILETSRFNNLFHVPYIAPDLYLDESDITKVSENMNGTAIQADFNIVLKVGGNANFEGCFDNLFYDGVSQPPKKLHYCTLQNSVLKPGDSISVSTKVDYKNAGTYNIGFMADGTGNIFELDEMNNAASVDMAIGQ